STQVIQRLRMPLRKDRNAARISSEKRPGSSQAAKLTARVHLVEIDDVGIRLLDPAPRGPPDLPGERREADRYRDRCDTLAGRTSTLLSLFPVRARGRRPRAF